MDVDCFFACMHFMVCWIGCWSDYFEHLAVSRLLLLCWFYFCNVCLVTVNTGYSIQVCSKLFSLVCRLQLVLTSCQRQCTLKIELWDSNSGMVTTTASVSLYAPFEIYRLLTLCMFSFSFQGYSWSGKIQEFNSKLYQRLFSCCHCIWCCK